MARGRRPEPDLNGRWRVGRSLGRTIYVEDGSEGDRVIGMFDDPEYAELACAARNRLLDDAAEALDPATEELREAAAEVVERSCAKLPAETATELRATMIQLIDLASRHAERPPAALGSDPT